MIAGIFGIKRAKSLCAFTSSIVRSCFCCFGNFKDSFPKQPCCWECSKNYRARTHVRKFVPPEFIPQPPVLGKRRGRVFFSCPRALLPLSFQERGAGGELWRGDELLNRRTSDNHIEHMFPMWFLSPLYASFVCIFRSKRRRQCVQMSVEGKKDWTVFREERRDAWIL